MRKPRFSKTMLRRLPLLGEFDVAVAGAGPAGVGAAAAAARAGKKTLLIEKQGCPGGVASNSGVAFLMGFEAESRQIVGGLPDELIRILSRRGEARFSDGSPVENRPLLQSVISSVHGIRMALLELLDTCGCEKLFYTGVVAACADRRRIDGLVVQTPGGLGYIKANCFVDATADAYLIHSAHGETVSHPAESCMTKTLFFSLGNVKEFNLKALKEKYALLFAQGRAPIPFQDQLMAYPLLAPGTIEINMTMTEADGLDAASLTKADAVLRKQIDLAYRWLKEEFEEFKDSYLTDTSPLIGVRCGRTIRGVKTLSRNMVDTAEPVDHPVSLGMRHYGGHGLRGFAPDWQKRHRGIQPIPWETLIPVSFDNALAAGRCISAEAETMDCFRFMARCMAIGQAAGTGAALCEKQVGRIRYELLRDRLLEQNAILR